MKRGMTPEEADDEWTEFGRAGSPHRAPLARTPDLTPEQLTRMGYTLHPRSPDNAQGPYMTTPSGGAIFGANVDALWSAARADQRRRLIGL